MIKTGLNNRYKVDPYGTEEILSEASNSVAPKLTIDYGDEVQEAEFTIRPTKGSLDTNISPIAVLNSIKGNTIVWNQLVENGDFALQTPLIIDSSTGTISISNKIATFTLTSVSGSSYMNGVGVDTLNMIPEHKYALYLDIKSEKDIAFIANGTYSGSINSRINGDFITKYGVVTAADTSRSRFYLAILNSPSIGDTIQFRNFHFHDLTIIYGAGNEPTTAAQFEADYYKWFGKQLSYEDYDTGSLRSCKMTGIKTTDTTIGPNTVVWNQLCKTINSNWTGTNCQLSVTDGVATVTPTDTRPYITSDDNTLSVLSSHKYYVSSNIRANGNIARQIGYSYYYNGFGPGYKTVNITTAWNRFPFIANAMSNVNNGKPTITVNNALTTDLFYFKDFVIIDLTVIYGSGNEPSTPEEFEEDYMEWFGKPLTYEEYDSGSLRFCNVIGLTSIPVTTLKGKLNGEGSSVVVFPDGMKRAGSVYDEIYRDSNGVTKAVKRIGKVDLSNRTWNYNNSIWINPAFYCNLEIVCKDNTNQLCTQYNYNRRALIDSLDKNFYVGSNGVIFIVDSSYTDGATFKTAMSGVYLFYLLATPEEYILDEWDVEKIMLGSTEIKKVYLGNQLMFEPLNTNISN